MKSKNSDIAFIFKQSFINLFWGIIFIPLFITAFWFKFTPPEKLDAYGMNLDNLYIRTGIAFYIILVAIYAFINTHIKNTETVIRLMSEKDGNKITSAQSSMISKKIFSNSIKFEFIQFLKYYFFAVLIYIVVFGNVLRVFFNFLDETATVKEAGIAFAIGGATILLGYIYTHYFLAAKTRFIWFTYMSHYGENFSSSALFDEVKKLNNIDKSDDRVAIVGYFKRDMAVDGSSLVTSSTIAGMVPKGLGSDVANGYVRGIAVDASEYSKMKLNYRQYKKAYNTVYGKNPQLSSHLFRIIDSSVD